MSRSPRRFACLALGVALVLTACSSDNADYAGAAGDADSARIAPQRIVSLSPTATEMLFAIDAGDQVIAVDEFSNYPAEAPVTDLSGWQPNVEAIAGYEPDLVVSESPIEGLGDLDIDTLVQEAPATIDGVYEQIEALGQVTGHQEEAEGLIAEMQSSIEKSVADAAGAGSMTYYHELGTELYTATSQTFIGSVYALFDLENIADPSDADGSAGGYPQLSEEVILDADPDIIFLADTIGYGQTIDSVAERPGWDQLTAVNEGHIIELNDDVASRWGPRVPEFVYAVSNAIQKAS